MIEDIDELLRRLPERTRNDDWATDEVRAGLTVFSATGEKLRLRTLPPLSEIQIASGEISLGFTLPNSLRRIYSEIGNGGFGPGYGLLPLVPLEGAFAGYESVVELFTEWQSVLREDAYNQVFRRLLPISDWGGGEFSCLLLRNDKLEPSVIRFKLGDEEWITRPLLRESNQYLGPGLLPEYKTLVTWLGGWVDGEDVRAFPYSRPNGQKTPPR